MTDFWAVLIGMALLVVVGGVAVVLLYRRGVRSASPIGGDGPARRLAILAGQRPGYRIVVGIPPTNPTSWAPASRVTGEYVTVEGYGVVPLRDVRAFAAAYPNGQMVDCELAGLPPPEGMTGLSRGRQRYAEALRSADLREGGNYLRVEHGPCALRPGDRSHYATTLTDVSDRRLRVTRFAGSRPTPGGWELDTVTGSFYSAGEFREWYGMGPEEWIGPGQSVTDPNNYGGRPSLWAYYGQTEDGDEFIAGGVWE